MRIGRVEGQVIATVKDPSIEGFRLFIIQALDEHLKEVGKPLVAIDGMSCAGPGDLVYFAEKRDAAIALGDEQPVDATIMGFVDRVFAEKTVGGPVISVKGE